MNRGQLWTKEEEGQLITEVKNGISLPTIATTHGRSLKAIELRIGSMIHQYQLRHKDGTLRDACIRVFDCRDESIVQTLEMLFETWQTTSNAAATNTTLSSMSFASSDAAGVLSTIAKTLQDIHRECRQIRKLLQQPRRSS